MRSFTAIEDRAARRQGGAEAMEALLPLPLPVGELAAVPDDLWARETGRPLMQLSRILALSVG